MLQKAKYLTENKDYNMWVGAAYKNLLTNTPDFAGEEWQQFNNILKGN